jgi:hypothetical protein
MTLLPYRAQPAGTGESSLAHSVCLVFQMELLVSLTKLSSPP